jgi:rod shape-determining protein MreB
MFLDDKLKMEIKGRDMVSGLPKNITVTSDDVTDAIAEELQGIISAVKEVMHRTPPELCADVMEKGMMMSGGSSLLRNIDQLFGQAIGVPCFVADDSLYCVVKGTGIALENLESYKRSILATR